MHSIRSRSFARFAGFALAVGLFVSAAACTKKSEDTAATGGSLKGTKVHLAAWSNYVAPEVLAEFTKQSGVEVVVSNYSSNEELLAKLQAGATGYDVALPSDYMVFAMKELQLLVPLDKAKIPNASQLDAKLLGKKYDADNSVSLPYDWGTTGIAIHRDKFKGELKSWNDLFTNPELAGKFTLLDDVRETLGAALKAQGKSLNSANPAEIEAAKKLLLSVKPRVKAFTSEPMVGLREGEIAVAHAYMSDALQARRDTKGRIEYVIPAEGGTLWIDNLVIPKGAPNVAGAHALINFLLEAANGAKTVDSVRVAPANPGAIPLLPAELRADTGLFPAAEVLNRLEAIDDLGEKLSLWDRAWTEVKAGG